MSHPPFADGAQLILTSARTFRVVGQRSLPKLMPPPIFREAQQTSAGTMCLPKRSRSPDQAVADWRRQKHRNEATVGRPRSIPQ